MSHGFEGKVAHNLLTEEEGSRQNEVYEIGYTARYLLYRRGYEFPLLQKCGLLQGLCTEFDDSSTVTLELHDIPGGEDAFELCAKFCYGLTINLSAYNFVPAFCAATFLRMTESVEQGNFVLKLEAFFNSCILEGWKDSIVTLQSTVKLMEWSENLGIIRRCIDSIVEKILTPPAKVAWSYTYTRPGFRKHKQPIPKDWWTEDISDLDIDLFRCIITAIRSTHMLSPQLIGEALHVYACRWLPDTARIRPSESSVSRSEDNAGKSRKVLDSIVNMIPADRGSVSVRFLLRLLSIADYLKASAVTKTELIRRSSLLLEEATVNDLLFPSQTLSDQHFYNMDLVMLVLESFLVFWRRQAPANVENTEFLESTRKIGKLIDSYLQEVAKDENVPISKLVSLAQALPDVFRRDHDGLYKAINIYLKEHPGLSKADKKQLCRILDCQKLSPEVRAHAVKNERLPLRTVVQVLFFGQEKDAKTSMLTDDISELQLGGDEQSSKMEGMRKSPAPESSTSGNHKLKRLGKMSLKELFRKAARGEIEEVELDKNREEGSSGSKLEVRKKTMLGRIDHVRNKSRDR